MNLARQFNKQLVPLIVYIPLIIVLSNCAYSPSVPDISSPLQENLQRQKTQNCSNYFVVIDRAVFNESVVDVGEFRLRGFPYLRINRFLASYDNLPEDNQRFSAWVDRLQAVDQQARKIELANLPEQVHWQLKVKFSSMFHIEKRSKDTLIEIVKFCGDLLRKVDMHDARLRKKLIDSRGYPDDYQMAKRVFGIYPLTGLFVKMGVNSYQQETRDVFDVPLQELETKGKIQEYIIDNEAGGSVQLSQAEVQEIVVSSSQNVLAIPEPSAEEKRKLFTNFAPIIKVDTVGDYDRLGKPVWREEQIAQIDVDTPVLYTLMSHVRFGEEILLQLNYVMWFSGRPLDGTFDILGGHMDGITWRVTIGRDGRPLIYDVMHNCGCYHMFFPTARLSLKESRGDIYQEAPLLPQPGPDMFDETFNMRLNKRVVLQVESKTHYLQRVTTSAQAQGSGISYVLRDYNLLRSLPYSQPNGTNGRKSLFAWDAIVRGTERAERWLLWPMGIPEPGAMRQWGHHATAFLGRRHFDDADLLDRYFTYTK